MIVYSKSSGLTPAAIGRLETPIKMIIEHESDNLKKKGGPCDWLFNIEKSNRFGETLVVQNEFDVFDAVAEGSGVTERDAVRENYSKFIEHIQFMKEFAITAEMMEDANYGIASDAKRRVENFTRAYYKTINKICELAIANGTSPNMTFNGARVNLNAPDGLPLFCSEHNYGNSSDNRFQSNYYWGSIFNSGNGYSAETFEQALAELSIRLRNMKDENGEPLGYTADTVILPGNKPMAEVIAKKVCGSYNSIGGSNGINIHYDNWNLIVLPSWAPEKDSVIVMSSEANKNLSGNMFFNRVPLTITNWVDNHTGNYIWNGRCRFGVGFGSYKHLILAVDADDPVDGASWLN